MSDLLKITGVTLVLTGAAVATAAPVPKVTKMEPAQFAGEWEIKFNDLAAYLRLDRDGTWEMLLEGSLNWSKGTWRQVGPLTLEIVEPDRFYGIPAALRFEPSRVPTTAKVVYPMPVCIGRDCYTAHKDITFVRRLPCSTTP